MGCVIGVDFDNTVVSYDDVMHRVALQQGLIQQDVPRSKQHIRDSVRQLVDGEIAWQKLQGLVYGPRMGEARLIAGVAAFFQRCNQYRVSVYIISHKTEYGHYDETRTNLRVASLTWMRENRFFEEAGLGLSEEQVFFEPTRRSKIARIISLKCTHFIDDLEETFLEDSFPQKVERILYAAHSQHSIVPGLRVAGTWENINDHFFGVNQLPCNSRS